MVQVLLYWEGCTLWILCSIIWLQCFYDLHITALFFFNLFSCVVLIGLYMVVDHASFNRKFFPACAKNNFPFETTKHSSEYREFLRSCCWGVIDLGSLRGLDLWNVSYPLVGCDTITHFVDNSDDVCRCNQDRIQSNLKAHPKLQTN